jgi:hypothetical protein
MLQRDKRVIGPGQHPEDLVELALGHLPPGLGAGLEGRFAGAAGRVVVGWGWHGAVSGMFRRPARLA